MLDKYIGLSQESDSNVIKLKDQAFQFLPTINDI